MQTTTRSRYAPNTRLSSTAQTSLGVDDAESALIAINNRIENLDPDKRISAIAPAALPNPLPAANKGNYFYFNSEGTITVNTVDYKVNKGDWLWCNSDNTAEGNETNWEVVALPEGKSPYYADPVIEVLPAEPPVATYAEGDRILISSSPPTIKVLESGAWIDALFPSGAVTSLLESDRLYKRKGNDLIYYLPSAIPLYLRLGLLGDLNLSQVTPDGLVYPLVFNQLLFPPAFGEWDSINNWFVPSETKFAQINISLNIKEPTTEPEPFIVVGWRRTNDNGTNWENLKDILETKGEFGLFSSSQNIKFETGWSYQPVLKLSVGATTEDIILAENTCIEIGSYNEVLQQYLEDLDTPLAPIIVNRIVSNHDLNTGSADVEFTLQVLSESKAIATLIPSLYEGNTLIEAKPAITNIAPGATFSVDFTAIAGFAAGTGTLKDLRLEVDYA